MFKKASEQHCLIL